MVGLGLERVEAEEEARPSFWAFGRLTSLLHRYPPPPTTKKKKKKSLFLPFFLSLTITRRNSLDLTIDADCCAPSSSSYDPEDDHELTAQRLLLKLTKQSCPRSMKDMRRQSPSVKSLLRHTNNR
ncbi:uncharacterized protein J3R85_006167 [Psidium guajava]|nr:uncharacterized protein J3R85_006167 [Psidium guajava]